MRMTQGTWPSLNRDAAAFSAKLYLKHVSPENTQHRLSGSPVLDDDLRARDCNIQQSSFSFPRRIPRQQFLGGVPLNE